MKRIQIVDVPPGQAPEWVRKSWVGLEMDARNSEGAGLQLGVLGGQSQNAGGYAVSTREALDALNRANPNAAEWFRKKSIAAFGDHLIFARHVCREI